MTFGKVTSVRFSGDASQVVGMSASEFRAIWKYTHADVIDWCKENIPEFKQGKLFNTVKKAIAEDINFVYTRKLDSRNTKSDSQKVYTDAGLERIKELYLAGE